MSKASLVVRNAVLLTVSDARPEPFAGWLAVDADGRLMAVEPGEPPGGFDGAEIVDADGAFVAPGFSPPTAISSPAVRAASAWTWRCMAGSTR